MDVPEPVSQSPRLQDEEPSLPRPAMSQCIGKGLGAPSSLALHTLGLWSHRAALALGVPTCARGLGGAHLLGGGDGSQAAAAARRELSRPVPFFALTGLPFTANSASLRLRVSLTRQEAA